MKKWIIRLGEIGIPLGIFLAILWYGYVDSIVEVPEEATLIFSDSDAATEYLEQIRNDSIVVSLDANQYQHNKNHTKIIFLGIKDSPTEKIIATVIGEQFKREYNVTTVLRNNEQEIVMYYAQTEEELLALLAQSIHLQQKNPADSEPVLAVHVVPYDRSNILGAVVGCTAIAEINYVQAIIDNTYNPSMESYVRHQMYDPFASSTFQNIVLKPGQEGAKELAESILEDVAGQEVVRIYLTCTDCGQEITIPMKITDYELLSEDMSEWKTMLEQSACTSCLGSSVSIGYEFVDTMDIYGLNVDLSQGKIEPSGVLDRLLGKGDDVYDNLPKSYMYTQTCPDYVPRIIISVLLPVFKDWQGNIIEPDYDWGNMQYNFNLTAVGSFSNPVSFNPVAYVTLADVFVYNYFPQYDVYFAGSVRSSPEGIIESQEGVYQGSYYLSAPLTAEFDKKNYVFHHWEINGQSYFYTKYYMTYAPFNAIAHYFMRGFIEDVDLAAQDISVARFEHRYNVTFFVVNNGHNVSSDFEYDVYVDDILLKHDSLNELAYGAYNKISLLFDVEDIFYDSKDQHIIKVVLDPDDNVLETTESNNEVHAIVEKEKPDLAVYDYPLRTYANNGTYTVSFTIFNQGYVDITQGFEIALSADNNNIDSLYYGEGIGAGENVSFTRTYSLLEIFTTGNDALLEIFVDSTAAINEKYEKNNIAEKKLERTGPDIVIEDVSMHSHSPSKGEYVVIDVLLKNIGETTAESGTVELTFGDGSTDSQELPLLNPGENSTLSFTKLADDCGKHVFHAIVSDVSPRESDIWQNGMYDNEFRVDCEGTEVTTGTTCDDVCPGTGTCMGGGCTYSISYHESAGDAWCIGQHDSAYACCCMIG